jgi:glycogen operon protein
MAAGIDRIDIHPTVVYADPATGAEYPLRPGRPLPFGATLVPGGVNFSIFSRHATSCALVLFDRGAPQPKVEIPFPDAFRIGDVFTMVVFGLDYESVEYGFRMDGPWSPFEGHRFDRSKVLLDPYAKAVGGRDRWGQPPDWNDVYPHRARLVPDDFHWEQDRPLEIPLSDLVIYEMHVRSFTRHPSAGVRHPGTFAAIRQKIPYLKELGVNCVELLPIYEFDEFENSRPSPLTGETLMNYWGYSTLGFFAPKAGYAATGRHGMQVDELKQLVQELHASGIEVMLDVVFNHTAEGNERGPTIHFRGLDNKAYYMLAPGGHYFNFSGTGNTMNCNHPVVRAMVLDCLRYWASEYHIDGFRFDLAAILGRDQSGAPLANPPLLESLAYDPILAKCKLVAEAWDAGGLYQVGSFPAFGRWAEWNGKYRDHLRQFVKGEGGLARQVAARIEGSPDLYAGQDRGTTASINFITCHDGFTLMDLVSYDGKHNEANGEDNRDGSNDNYSWNCGAEGPTADAGINALRRRQMKNAVALLMTSQGVPMILMGDEVGRTQRGNNNAYCLDGEINWMDWRLLEENAELFRFFRLCIAFRKAHPVLRNDDHLQGRDLVGSGYPDVSWHGVKAWRPDWSDSCRTVAFMLDGAHAARRGQGRDDDVYVAANVHWEAHDFELPQPAGGRAWHVFANTGAAHPHDVWELGSEPRLENQGRLLMGPRSVAILVSR